MSKKRKNVKFSCVNEIRCQLSSHSNTTKKPSKASDVKVSEVLDRVLNLSESELLKLCGDAQSRFREHPELIISDVENIRRFQNETGQKVFDCDSEQALDVIKTLLEGTK